MKYYCRAPKLGGETSVPFVRGVAEFTRLRVDRPAEELALLFRTNPTRFEAATSIRFTVVAPPLDTPKVRLGFVLHGDLESLPRNSMAVLNSIRIGLGSQLDIDISRIKAITYKVIKAGTKLSVNECYCIGIIDKVTNEGIVVEFDLLERHSTDPPDVKSLGSTTAFMEQLITDNQLIVRIACQTSYGDPIIP